MSTTVLSAADYVVISVMLAISACVGLFFRFTGGRQKTTNEFLMAGRNMSIGPVAFSLMATYMSAISLLGVPAEVYMYSSQLVMWMLGTPVGAYIAAYGFLPVFFDIESSTAFEYMQKRFGKTARTVSAALFTLQMILYMAVVLYAPALALNAVTGLSVWLSIVALSSVCTFYCTLGGLKAVLWTDVFQSILMYMCIIAVVVKASMIVGFSDIFRIADEGGRLVFFNMSTDYSVRYTFWNSFLVGIFFSVSTYGANQAQIQRMLSVGDIKKAQKALLWSIPLIIVYNFFNFYDGLSIYSLYHDCDPMLDPNTELGSPDQLMPLAIMRLFGHLPGMAGLCIAGVFSASLSTVSSAVNSLTAVAMEDFIRPYCLCQKLSEKAMTVLAKTLAIGYGILTLILTFAVASFRGVIEASHILTGIVGGPLFGLYTLGMYCKVANQSGSLIGLAIGFAVNAWIGFGSYIAAFHVESLPRSIQGCFAENSTTYNHTYTQNSTAATQSSATEDNGDMSCFCLE